MNTLPGTRVLVTGLPGSGKTTLATTISVRGGMPHVEVDRLYFGPAFAVRPTFAEELRAAIEQDAWVIDDIGYPESRDLVWARADAVVWIDLRYGIPAARAVRRTWRRLRAQEEMLPGCRESWIGWGRPSHPVFIAVLKHGRERRAMQRRLADPRWAHLTVVRLRSPEAVTAFVASLPPVNDDQARSSTADDTSSGSAAIG